MRTTVLASALAVLLLLSGCTGALQGSEAAAQTNATATATTTTTTATPAPTDAPTASYNQTPHMGCQPGAIEKNGTCRVVTNGSNADIFSAENLSAITARNTTINGTSGYLARPADNGTYPAVVMIHEWWGLNENIRHMADILAGHGYVVFAVDLYDGRVATNSSEAAQLSGEVRSDPDEAVAEMSNATAGLRALPYTTDRVASLGWCFGGGQSLQLSLSDADLNATVVYYGTLTTNESTLRNVDGPVLGIFGAEDQVVPVETVREFNRTLGELGVEREIYVYEGAGHAFANPSGESFQPEATRDAWSKTLDFLNRTLKE
ncbi:dienelactone hydrolase family protein [Haloarcula nitratireducens]|uniref:Dienelactone hydrolase family protein n=1 Tax=Haloarcula nitratireducens TaxID=2487749 RepID=A0AAW4PD56_9EURY|nr:dienelactone hydrolase family protein [Halomicroarcula nitratireducens]MBX0295844.1 dienelactone hydrolase family protein [Halomicroarcula nitratireducens]